MPKTSILFVVVLTISTIGCRIPAASRVAADRVHVTGGMIEGTAEKNGIRVFKGIPFAAPPVGDLRWKAPQPVITWEGVKKTEKFAPSPMQKKIIPWLMGVPNNYSEDCLYLNVWTPAKDAHERLPVMVWIYGGAFSIGSTATPVYNGAYLAQKGVVVVSVAYRVGPFGFLAHPELSREGGKGNFGLLDQIAGLEWVKNNIIAFGGDPACVTIFGESAGAISVSMLAACPRAKGLFQRAIAESGASFAPPKLNQEGGHLIPTLEISEKEGVKFLAALKAGDIAAARALPAKAILKAGAAGWPTFDGDLLTGDAFELYQEGKFNDTPILIGTNSDEGGMFVRKNIKPEKFIVRVREGFDEHADKILAAYPHATKAQALRASKDLLGDTIFAWPTWTWAKLHAEKGTGKAFVYFFDYRRSQNCDGAGHGAEVGYVFGNLKKPGVEDVKMSDLISDYWVNFARTGNPNGPGLPEWQPFTTENQQVMFFDVSGRMVPVPNLKRLEVLDDYFTWRRGR